MASPVICQVVRGVCPDKERFAAYAMRSVDPVSGFTVGENYMKCLIPSVRSMLLTYSCGFRPGQCRSACR